MERKHDISLIIPSYNTEKHLINTYNSVRKYYKDVEMVIINDGSTDIEVLGTKTTQEVDFQNASFGGFSHPLPNPFPEGFKQSPALKETLFGDGTQVSSLFNDGVGEIFNVNNNYSNAFRIISISLFPIFK